MPFRFLGLKFGWLMLAIRIVSHFFQESKLFLSREDLVEAFALSEISLSNTAF